MAFKKETLVRVLRGTREILSNKDNWLRGAAATTADGKQCNPTDRGAAKFCVSGACEHVAARVSNHAPYKYELADKALQVVEQELSRVSHRRVRAVNVNDSGRNGRQRLLKAIRAGIKRLSK